MTMEPQEVTQQLQVIALQKKVLEATLLEKKFLEQQLENEQSQRKDLQERLSVEIHALDQKANSSMCTSHVERICFIVTKLNVSHSDKI